MPSVTRVDDEIDVGSDMKFERRWWRFERIMWVVMILLIGTGLSGVFGRGPLSKGSASAPGVPMIIHYQKFLRRSTPGELTIYVSRNALSSAHEACLQITDSLLDTFHVEQAVPAPVRVESVANGSIVCFSVEPAEGWARIVFKQESGKQGSLEGRIELPGKGSLQISQYTYP